MERKESTERGRHEPSNRSHTGRSQQTVGTASRSPWVTQDSVNWSNLEPSILANSSGLVEHGADPTSISSWMLPDHIVFRENYYELNTGLREKLDTELYRNLSNQSTLRHTLAVSGIYKRVSFPMGKLEDPQEALYWMGNNFTLNNTSRLQAITMLDKLRSAVKDEAEKGRLWDLRAEVQYSVWYTVSNRS